MAKRLPLYYRSPMRLLMLTAALVLASCSKSKSTPPTEERVYVSDEDGGNVVVISTTSDSVVAHIPVGKRPRGLRVSPDGARLFVALSGTPRSGPGVDESKLPPADTSADGIGIVDLSSLKLERVIPAGRDPELFDVTSDGKRLWVSNEDSSEASLVDIDAGKVVRQVPVGKEPEGVGIHPGGKAVYVTNEADDSVSVLDIESGQPIARIPTGKRPRSVVFTSDGTRAFVANEMTHGLTVVDAAAHKPIAELDLPGDLVRPMGLVISSDGRTLYVSNSDPKNAIILAWDVSPGGKISRRRIFADMTVLAKDSPGLPDGMTVDERGNLWATGPGGIV